MPVGAIVSRLLSAVRSHKARVTAVAAGVLAVLVSRHLSAARMGRVVAGRAKHGIKRFDRLLGNARLAQELPLFYAALCRAVVVDRHPVILIDWTHLHGRANALVASMAVSGRSLILFSEVHDVSKLGDAQVQDAFLQQLQRVLAKDSSPVIVCDAGFHGDFFRSVRARGWDFVARIRGTAKVFCKGRERTKRALYKCATSVAKDFPNSRLYAKRPINCRLVLVRRRHSQRRSKPTTNNETLEYRRAARDPWLLATSLDERTYEKEEIVELYGERMQIEETFRDAKSGAYGLGLNETRSRSKSRLAVQLLLAALALATCLLVGIDAEKRNEHLALQANSIKTRRVLSLVRLGLECIARTMHQVLGLERLRELVTQFRRPQICGDP